jgi:hypothetical protein
MNSHSILLFLFISAGLARAATQAAISQDKPPRIYVKTFIGSSAESRNIDTCLFS